VFAYCFRTSGWLSRIPRPFPNPPLANIHDILLRDGPIFHFYTKKNVPNQAANRLIRQSLGMCDPRIALVFLSMGKSGTDLFSFTKKKRFGQHTARPAQSSFWPHGAPLQSASCSPVSGSPSPASKSGSTGGPVLRCEEKHRCSGPSSSPG
jgi:hypothetical protein